MATSGDDSDFESLFASDNFLDSPASSERGCVRLNNLTTTPTTTYNIFSQYAGLVVETDNLLTLVVCCFSSFSQSDCVSDVPVVTLEDDDLNSRSLTKQKKKKSGADGGCSPSRSYSHSRSRNTNRESHVRGRSLSRSRSRSRSRDRDRFCNAQSSNRDADEAIQHHHVPKLAADPPIAADVSSERGRVR